MLLSRAGSRHDAPLSIPSPQPGYLKPKSNGLESAVCTRRSRQLELSSARAGFWEGGW